MLGVNKLLCPTQFGFRPKNQTSHVVHKLLNDLTENSVKNEITIATYLDLSKAFDCLQYDKLFYKLEKLGLEPEPLRGFKRYLTGRKQCVDIKGTQLDWLDVKLGVLQGSILGPILFLIYVNNINLSSDASFTKFADNTTIITSAPTLEEATNKMNIALHKVNICSTKQIKPQPLQDKVNDFQWEKHSRHQPSETRRHLY